jgi:L-malate glycosyltransferase
MNPSTGSQPGRPRVLMMLTSFQIGGTERQVINVALGLDRSRFDLHLASIHRYGPLLEEVKSLEVPQRSFEITSFYRPSTFMQALRLAWYIRKNRIQIVHTYGLYTNLFAIPAAKMGGASVIISSIRDRGDILTPMQRWFQRQVCRLADCVLVNADSIRDVLIGQGYRANKLAVICNGIVPSRFRRGQDSKSVREELGLPASARLVMVLSRLNPMKGVEYFLDAAAVVAQECPDVRFLIVGDGRNKSELQARAATLGLADRVVFTGFRTDASRLLSEVAVSVLPSLSEGLSNTILESMAAGVPVIATRVGGNPELIEDGVSGLLVPTRDSAALAAAMIKLLSNPRLASALSETGQRRIGEMFSMQSSIRQVEALYLKMIETPKTYLAEAATT